MPRRSSHERCETCGMRYDEIKCSFTFAEARRELRMEHDARIRTSNDYSRPPRRAAILGRMHQFKEMLFEVHERACAEASATDLTIGLLKAYDLTPAARELWDNLPGDRWLSLREYSKEHGGTPARLGGPVRDLMRHGLVRRIVTGPRSYAYQAARPGG